MRQTNLNELYHQNRLYNGMPMRTVTGEFSCGRVHCVEPKTKLEIEPSFLFTQRLKRHKPKKFMSKSQQVKTLSNLIKKNTRQSVRKKLDQFLDFLKGEKLPINIGDLYKRFGRRICTKTIQRRIKALDELGKITIKKVISGIDGKKGNTTIILKINRVRRNAR